MAAPPDFAAAAGAPAATPARGWAVLLLNRLHYTSVVLSSFAFGLFLPFIRADLGLTYLQVGVLQGVWWAASAAFLVPFSVPFGRFNPNRRALVALAALTPLAFTQGLATGFGALLAARFLTVLAYATMASARPLLLRQWAAPGQYATITAAGLSLHSAGMAAVLTFSPLLIVALGSWRMAYFAQGGLLAAQLLAWALLTRRAPAVAPASTAVADNTAAADNTTATDKATAADNAVAAAAAGPEPSPARALLDYPHAWLLGGVMLCLSASWTTVLTFLPTLLETERGIVVSEGNILFGFLYYALIPGGLAGSRIFRRITNRRLMVTAAGGGEHAVHFGGAAGG